MDKAHVTISAPGILTLTAQRVTGQPPATHAGKQIPINYLSGAVGARQNFTVAKGGGLVFSASFLAPVTKGTWPAFWLTGVSSWPPEIDMAEWKGSGKVSFNVFNTSSVAATKDVVYKEPGRWHDVKCELHDSGGGAARVRYWLDGQEVVTQYEKGIVGKEMYLVINLQMEGSSGAPGPGESKYLFF
jgi:beta-glucanase (GH16 family)